MTPQSFIQKYGPGAIAKNLWGNGPVPPKYKILFIGQGLLFMTALWIRTQDVEKAKHMKQKLIDAETQRAEMRGESVESKQQYESK
jgi:hypothetical protein